MKVTAQKSEKFLILPMSELSDQRILKATGWIFPQQLTEAPRKSPNYEPFAPKKIWGEDWTVLAMAALLYYLFYRGLNYCKRGESAGRKRTAVHYVLQQSSIFDRPLTMLGAFNNGHYSIKVLEFFSIVHEDSYYS